MTDGQGVIHVPLLSGVDAWFTSATVHGIDDANLAHHVPHAPDRLARARDRVAALTATDPDAWHLMRQVHGAQMAIVDATVPRGAELRDVDVAVTVLEDRPLVVLSADCLPILAAGRVAVGAAHAGWRGVVAGVPDALVDALVALGERPEDVRLAIGPAIGPCCYEVGPEVVEAIAAVAPSAVGRTRRGRPSVDLRRAARQRFTARGITEVQDLVAEDGVSPACTACEARWFSHRRDRQTGRQAGIIVRRPVDRGEG